MNEIWSSVTNSFIYKYSNSELSKVYTLYGEEIKHLQVIPGSYNDSGEFEMYDYLGIQLPMLYQIFC